VGHRFNVLRFSLVLLGAAAYGVLAILGREGFRAFFAKPPLAALFVVLLAMSVVGLFAGGNLSRGVREDRDNRWVIVVIGIAGLLDGYLPALSDHLSFWTIDGDSVRWLGVLLFAVGCMVRIWPVFVLGHRFSGLVAIQPGHALVTTGVYRFIRHPSYLGLLVTVFGWGLAFRSGVGLLLAGVFYPCTPCTNPSRRETAPIRIRSGVRELPRTHIASDSGSLLASDSFH
jgi:protein-S-isoprenylcysteine O-methyltransferase Ste14